MIDYDRKIIFIHIPKTAGSAIESVFLNEPRFLDHSDPERTELILHKYKNNFCGLHHPHASLRAHQIKLGSRFRKYKVFTVIRNPWEAIFSRFCYLFKLRNKTFFRPKNFEKFLLFYSEMHYQSLIGLRGEPHVHYILNYFDLETEVNRMLHELNVSAIKLPIGNVSASSNLDYRQFYSEKSKKIVEDYFWYEILRFGWQFESRRPETSCNQELPPNIKFRLNIATIRHRISNKIDDIGRRIIRKDGKETTRLKSDKKDLITAALCTHPPALPGLQLTIDSITEQVDQIYVYMNDIQSVPHWLQRPNIQVVLSKDALGDLKSNGKHYFAERIEGYCFALDDDIIYPPDYVKTMIEKIEAYKRKAIVCVHGSIIRYPFVSYYMNRICLPFTKQLQEDVRVDVGSSGTQAYHTDTIRFYLNDFPTANMDDIYLTIKAARNKVPIICIQREGEWLRDASGPDRSHTIYFNRSKYDAAATALIKENFDLFECNNLFLNP